MLGIKNQSVIVPFFTVIAYDKAME